MYCSVYVASCAVHLHNGGGETNNVRYNINFVFSIVSYYSTNNDNTWYNNTVSSLEACLSDTRASPCSDLYIGVCVLLASLQVPKDRGVGTTVAKECIPLPFSRGPCLRCNCKDLYHACYYKNCWNCFFNYHSWSMSILWSYLHADMEWFEAHDPLIVLSSFHRTSQIIENQFYHSSN